MTELEIQLINAKNEANQSDILTSEGMANWYRLAVLIGKCQVREIDLRPENEIELTQEQSLAVAFYAMHSYPHLHYIVEKIIKSFGHNSDNSDKIADLVQAIMEYRQNLWYALIAVDFSYERSTKWIHPGACLDMIVKVTEKCDEKIMEAFDIIVLFKDHLFFQNLIRNTRPILGTFTPWWIGEEIQNRCDQIENVANGLEKNFLQSLVD